MNKNIAAAIALIVLLIAGISTYRIQSQPQEENLPPQPNTESVAAASIDTNIDFALPDLDGTVRQLSDWNGKGRLVNFWATWCAPCRREIPLLKKTQEEHGSDGIQVIGIAVDFPEQVVAYAEEAQFNYPILVGQEDAMAAAEASGIDFIGMPFTMVIAPDGELIKTHIGEIVEVHIESIVAVFQDLKSGKIDIEGARAALETI
jgi:thiol-disulfide isomerase/thioredoxin